MASGITEKDVFTACDALVLAGERPTIERVRQKIGRGSPNTVGPMLDTWFKGLGRRLQDPGAFAPPSDIPEPVLQAAQHFWEVAQVNARADFEKQLLERLVPMQDEVDSARHAVTVAAAEKEADRNKANEARQQAAEVTARLDVERTAHAATTARLDSTRRQVDELTARIQLTETRLGEAEAHARASIEAAQERAAGAERRAALEIENERAARSRSDKRAEALEKRLESLQAASASQFEELAKARVDLDHEKAVSARLRAANDEASTQRQALDAALIGARLALERAETEAKTNQAAINQLLPLVADAKQKKTTARPRQHAKST